MAPSIARNTAVGGGEESTWGIPVSITNWRHLRSVSGGLRAEYLAVDDLYAPQEGAPSRHVLSRKMLQFQIALYMSYSRAGLWLKHALGSLSTSGAGPYVHTYQSGTLPTGLTVEIKRGNASNSDRHEGCKVKDWTLAVRPGDRAMLFSATLIGQTSSKNAVGTVSLGGADDFVLPTQVGSLTFNSVAYKCRSLQWSGSNGIEERFQCGSELTDEPVEAQPRAYSLEAEIEVDNDNLITAQLADTTGNLTQSWTGTGNNAVAFTGRNAYISEYDDPIPSHGVQIQRVKWIFQPGSSNPAVQFAVTNDNSSGIAN